MARILKISTIFCLLLLSRMSYACNNSTISITNQVDNGDGTYTYTLSVTVELGSLDITYYGMALVFQSTSGTPSIVAGSYTPTLVAGGALTDNLTGLIGSAVNSVAGDSDWNTYDNRTNVLSYEYGGFGGAAFDDFTRTITVTVSGCVSSILLDASVNSGSSSCEKVVSTGNNCSVPVCAPAPNAGTVTITGSGVTAAGANTYNINYGSTATIATTGFTLPTPNPGNSAGMVLALFDCLPSLADLQDPSASPCYIGVDFGNSNTTTNSGVAPETGTIYAAYVTFDDITCNGGCPNGTGPDENGDGCIAVSTIYTINYLPAPSPCSCSTGVTCGGEHFDCFSAAASNYDDVIFDFLPAQYEFIPPLSTASGTSYQFCYSYTTGPTETSVGFANLVGTTGAGSCLTKTYQVYPAANCSAPLTPGAALGAPFANGFNYTVLPNTAYRFCVTVTFNNNNCMSLEDISTWIFNNTPGGGCGSCASPTCAIHNVATYNDRVYPQCWTPSCSISGPTTVTNCYTGVADATGFLGFANQTTLPSCVTRTWALTPAGSCPGTPITPVSNNVHGVASGFNPEYTGLTPGASYTLCVTMTVPNGCTIDGQDAAIPDVYCVTYYGNSCSLAATATATTQPTCGLNNGSITVTPGPTGYTYAWTGGLTGRTPTNVAPGTYTVTVTQTSTGCSATATVILDPSSPLSVTATPTDPTCGANNGSISVSPGPAGYTYAWTGGLSGQNPTNVASGMYIVTVTQTAGGCTGTASVTLNPSAPLSVTATPTDPTCGANNGSISVSPGPSGYTYAWTGGLSGQNPTNVASGMYVVTVTQTAGGCTGTASVTLNPSTPLSVTATPTDPTCGANNGSISVLPGPAGYTYAWTGGLSGQNPTNVASGMYIVTVTQTAGGCTGTASVTLNPSTPLSVTATPTQPTCGANNGSISVSPGPAGYTYAWTGGLSGQNPTNVAPGAYIVTVTQTAGGCTGTASVTLNPSSPLSVTATPTQPTCGGNNGSISVSPGPAGYTYAWTGGLSGQNPTNVASGMYIVTVTQTAGGCTGTASVTLNPSTPLSVTATPTDPTCGANNGSISVSPGPAGYTYAWTGGLSGQNPTNVASGMYVVTVTQTAGGCTGTASVTLNSSSPLSVTATPTDPTCGANNGSISVSPGPAGYTYAWTGGLSGQNPTNVASGMYIVTVTQTAGGCTGTASVTLNPSTPLSVTATPTDPTCGANNGSISVSPGPAGYTYSWTGGLSGQNPNNVASGMYVVTVTQTAGGCTGTASVTLNPSTPLSVTATPTDPTCGANNGSISVSPGPAGYTYAWTGGLSGQNPTNVAPGAYIVTVTQTAGGCTGTASVTLNPSTPLSVTATPTDPTCGANNGSISVSPGPAGYTYAWTGGLSGQNPTNVASGMYVVTVTQTAGGCTGTASVTLNPSTPLSVTATPTDPTCGANNGSISVSPGPVGYTYAWTGGLSGQNPTNVASGMYVVTVTQTAGGCTGTASVTLNPSTPLSVTATPTDPTCGANNGSISVSPGPAGYTYAWTGGLSGQNPTGVSSGMYTVTVTQTVGGCTGTASVTINPSSQLSVTATPVQPTCGLNNGSINVTPGPAGYTYAWTGGLSGQNPTNVTPGTYTVTVTQTATTCTASATIILNNSTGITASLTPTQPTCGLSNGAIAVSPSGAGFTYSWTGGLSGVNPTNVASGTYSVTVTQTATGCTAIASVTLSPSTGITASTSITQPTCGQNNGSISVSPGPAGYTYTWTGGLSGQNPTNVSPGTYTVTVTETASGCTASATAIVNPSVNGIVLNVVTACGAGPNTGSINTTATPGNGGSLSYTINGTPDADGDQTGLANGPYTIIVTESPSGCTMSEIVTINCNCPTITVSGSLGICQNSSATFTQAGGAGGGVWSVTPTNAGTITAGGVFTASGTYNGAASIIYTALGCNGSLDIQVNSLSASASATQPTCGLSNGSISVLPSGAGYTYSWTGGLSGSTPNNVAPGNYTVTVTQTATGCTATATVVINTSSSLSASATSTQPSCGLDNGAISVTPSGAGFTYSWTGGLAGQNPTGLAPGTYTVTVTQTATGCTASSTAVLNPSSGINAGLAITQPSCGLNNGGISVTPSGAGFTYAWTGGIIGQNPTNIAPGTYTVTVTQTAGGCTSSATAILNNSTGITASAVPTQPSCGLNNGSISVNPSGAGYTYSWTGGLSGVNPVNVSPGTYTVTVTQTAGGCTASATAVLNNSTGITANTTAIQPTCGLDNGAISVTPVGAGFTYSWTGGLAGANPINVAPGTYTVTVTQTATGCTSTRSTVINTSVNGIALSVVTNCGGGLNTGSINTTATPGNGGTLSYTVNGIADTDGDQTGLANGSYIVIVTESPSGCTTSETVTINCGCPTITINGAADVCQNTTTSYTQSGGVAGGVWSVSPANAGTINASGSFTASSTFSGTASIIYTASGCNGSLNIQVNGIAASTAVSQPFCGLSNGTISANPSGAGYTYAWTGGLAGANPANIAPGTYTVTITQTATGCTSSATAVLNNSTGITANTTATQPTCGLDNGAISVTPAGAGFTYSWTGVLAGANPINVAPGTYTVTVTQTATGCTSTQSTVINTSVNGIALSVATNCGGGLNTGSINTTATPGNGGTLSYTVNGVVDTDGDQTGLANGSYIVIVTESPSGCTTSETVTINCGCPTITISGAADICQNSITSYTQSGGVAGGVWSVSPANAGTINASGSFNASSSFSGTASIIYTASGCNGSLNIQVNGIAVTSTVTAATCGLNNGNINLSVSGGTTYSYAWTGGLTGQNPTNVPAGTYTVTVTETATGCTASTVAVVNNSTGITAAVTAAQPTCGLNNGALNVTPSGVNYTYTWTGGLNSSNPVNVAPGTYTVTVTEVATGCTSTTSVILNPSTGVAAVATATQPSCGLNNGAIIVTPTGAGFTYAWTGGLSGANPTAVAPGTYTVTVTNTTTTCTATASVTLDPSTGVTAVATAIQPSCGLNNGAISVTPNGASYSYTWTGGLSGANPTAVAAGAYTVTVTQTTGNCTSSATVILNPSVNGITLNVLTNCGAGQNSGSITTTATPGNGGTLSFTINGVADSDGNEISLSNGVYTIVATEAPSGCSQSQTVTINCGCPTITISGATGICQNTTAAYSQTGGIAGGAWSVTPANAGTIDASGNFTASATYTGAASIVYAAAGCNGTLDIQVNGITAATTATQSTCSLNNGAITVTPAGAGFTYAWTGGLTGTNPTNVAPGTYTVTVTQTTGGCTSTASVTLNPSTGITAAATANQPTCGLNNGTISVTPTGAGFSYAWTGGLTGANPTNVAPGTYTVTVTQTSGNCTSTASVTLSPTTGITAAATATQPTCGLNNGTISVTPTGAGFSYAWTGGLTGANPTNVAPGTYTVTVTQTTGGCTSTASVTLNPSTGITAAATATQPTCGLNNGAISVTPAGAGFTYAWTGSLTGANPTNVAPGTYTVTVTQTTGGCTATASVTLNPSTGITAATTTTQPTCGLNNGTISVTPTGPGFTYAWTGGLIGANPTNVAPGTYTVTVTQTTGGCTSTASVTLNPSTGITAATTATQPTCGLNNGAISVTPAGAGFTYDWTGGLTGQNPTNVAPGSYTVVVTEAATGCVSTATVTLNPSTGISAAATITQPSCGLNNGSISVTPAGAGFSYAWTGSSLTGANPMNVAPGLYTVTVTQIAGSNCSSVATVTLNPSSGITASAAPVQASCDGNNGIVSVTPSGAGYTYSWTGGLSGAMPSNAAPGTYTVTVTQTGAGCTATASVTVQATAIDVNFSFKAPSCPGRNDGYILLESIAGGMEPYSINLNDAGITTDSIGNLAPGSYELYVEDVNGCSWTDDIVLAAPVAPEINAGPDFLLHLGDSVLIQATTNVNLLLADTIFWTPSDWLNCSTCLQPEIKPLDYQELTVTVVDQNGCVDSDKVIVRVQKDRRVYIPNIFSPEVENGGSNVLTVYTGAEVRKIKTFLIFDRWGENIYRADDMLPNSGFGWDGKFRGKYPNNDVFVYMVEVEFIDGETEVFSGDVTLYR